MSQSSDNLWDNVFPSDSSSTSTAGANEKDDEKLRKHIDSCRTIFKSSGINVNEQELLISAKEVKIKFSSVIIEMKEQKEFISNLSNKFYNKHLECNGLSTTGEIPWIYSECKNSKEIFKKMAKENEDLHLELETKLLELENLEKTIVLLRRKFETILENI